jgi:glycosyltransferase involved in cell wall biosynthesis
MRIALVHDWLNGMRGGERVLEALCEEFPDAPIFTLIHEPKRVSAKINAHPIATSWFQRVPLARRKYRWLLPLMPGAIERLAPRDVDAVISLSHCVAKGVRVPPGVPHLCYCFTPMRYIWDQFDQYIGPHTGRRWARPLVNLFRPRLQRWDVRAARQVTRFLAISEHVARKILLYYQREAEVLYPPVNTEFFTPGSPQSRIEHRESKIDSLSPIPYPLSPIPYLVVSALVPYKRVDLAIRAANCAGFPLRVVGEGPEWANLARMAGPTVQMLGWVSDERLRDEYRGCRALLFPGEEDFGLVPIEAMACGTPVIAYRRGGVTESVIDGETGLFFDAPAPEPLEEAIRRFEARAWDPAKCRAQAERFSAAEFRRRFRQEVDRIIGERA